MTHRAKMTPHMNEQFPQDPELIYLNHAAVGPWPQCTYDAVNRFAKENVMQGAKHYPRWLQVEQRLKQRLQHLVNAESTDTIALLKNTSEALSVIAYGLNWHAGDNIVLAAHEFPSNRIVWQSLQQYGVEIRIVDFQNFNDAENKLIAATDNKTRLLTSSSVHYANGLRIDLAKLGEHCAKHNILFCVDAIQSLGALPFDAQAIQADFVVADGHKWMLGPEGLALFYCRNKQLQELKLHQYGWHMVEDVGNYDRTDWQTVHSARRFECGSPNMLGAHALEASLGLLEKTDIKNINALISQHIDYLIDKIQALPNTTILSPLNPERRAGILTFRIEQQNNAAVQKYLMDNNVICAYRGGGIRFSPHYYNQQKQLDHALDVLKRGLETVGK